MSVNFTLKPVTYDGDASTEGMPPGLVYLSAKLEASDEKYSGFVSGWMRPEARALVKAAPELLESLKALLKVCDNGPITYRPGEKAARDAARAAIAKATGEA